MSDTNENLHRQIEYCDKRSVPLHENARGELWEYFRDIWENIK